MDLILCYLYFMLFTLVYSSDSSTVPSILPPSICRVCFCSEWSGNVNCDGDNLSTFFTWQEWEELKSYMEPKTVDLSNNAIVNITAVPHLPIEVLRLSYNNIEHIDDLSFSRLMIRELYLTHNKLTEKLNPYAFKGSKFSDGVYMPMTELRVLNLAYNEFHSIHPELFDSLSNLTSLDLSGNPLATIDQNTSIAIDHLENLEELHLHSCRLTELPRLFLNSLHRLERLDLSHNQFTSVPYTLDETRCLAYLALDNNPIEELDMFKNDALGFSFLPKLEELHMCFMPNLRRIGAGALGNLRQLSKLHLNYNPNLAEIDPMAFSLYVHDPDWGTYEKPPIKELYLEFNNLSVIDRQLLDRWDLVERIDISFNPLRCDCSTRWMADELLGIIERTGLDEIELKNIVCQEPSDLRGIDLKSVHDAHALRCETEETSTITSFEPVVWHEDASDPELDGDSGQTTLPETISDTKSPPFNSKICRVCACSAWDGGVNCRSYKLGTFFTWQEWEELESDMEPKTIVLSNNDIVNITAVPHLPIEVLRLSYNNIEHIDDLSFRRLMIRELDLSHNKLTGKLNPNAFKGYEYRDGMYMPLELLRVLNLAYNEFHSIHPELFDSLTNLTSLDLSGNPLATIDQNMSIAFSHLENLEELHLRSCRLTKIPSGFLETLYSLERLDLSENQFTSVPYALREARSLLFLALDQNPFEELNMFNRDALGFPNMDKLEELHMCFMPKLRRIGAGALGYLRHLSKLHLNYNPNLAEIDPMAFALLVPNPYWGPYEKPRIKELYLKSNNLSVVDRQLLDRWDLVERIDISFNPLRCDCSTRWMVDELLGIIERNGLDEWELNNIECHEPSEMRGVSLKFFHDAHALRCEGDERGKMVVSTTNAPALRYADQPEPEPDRDSGQAGLLGTSIGLLLVVMLVSMSLL